MRLGDAELLRDLAMRALLEVDPFHDLALHGVELLQRGAAKVYAVDVGHGQLAWKLRQDPRVVVLERTNARHLTRAEIPEAPGIVTCDASFIGLATVLPASLALAAEGADLVALVKPQFEVGKGRVGKGGVVRDEEARRGAVTKVRDWAAANGFSAHEDVESPITGPAGNLEYLLLLRTT